MILLDGKKLAIKLKTEFKKLPFLKEIKLAIIMVGDNESSKIYIKNKKLVCDELGINYEEYLLDEKIGFEELAKVIINLNKRCDLTGILLQSPLPKQIKAEDAFNLINPNKDIDGLTKVNRNRLSRSKTGFIPCTPLGILRLLEEYEITLESKKIVVVGRSNIVGQPLVLLLKAKKAEVIICHSQTSNLKEVTKKAEILISAVGKPNLITAEMVSDGVVVIDAGIYKDKILKIRGDVDFSTVSKKASYITKVPGGVGPMTIMMLINNLIKAYQIKK